MTSDHLKRESVRTFRKTGLSEREAILAAYPEAQGLGAVVARQKKERDEAQAAASGASDVPVTPSVPAVVAEEPVAPAKPKVPVVQMPKDELDALRLLEQKRFEARRKKAQEKK